MSEISEKIDHNLKDAELSARDGLHGQALEYLEAAEQSVDELDDMASAREFRIKILNNRGIIFKNLENFDESQSCFKKALSLINENGGLKGKLPVGVHLNLANLLSRKRKYNDALVHFNNALDAADKLSERDAVDLKCKIHNNLALFYCNFGDRDKAQAELDKCLEYRGQDDFHIDFGKERQAWILTNLGLIHSELADEKELSDQAEAATLRRASLGFFRNALDIYKGIGYGVMEARTLLNIAVVERRLDNKKESTENLNFARAIAERLRSDKLKAMVLEQCVNFHLQDPTSPFKGALEELFALLSGRNEPLAERILRRIEDRARRAGQTEVLRKIRQRLRSEGTGKAARDKVDDPVRSDGQ